MYILQITYVINTKRASAQKSKHRRAGAVSSTHIFYASMYVLLSTFIQQMAKIKLKFSDSTLCFMLRAIIKETVVCCSMACVCYSPTFLLCFPCFHCSGRLRLPWRRSHKSRRMAGVRGLGILGLGCTTYRLKLGVQAFPILLGPRNSTVSIFAR